MYYLAIAKKYWWQERNPNQTENAVTYQEFALDWLKNQLAQKILIPEYISFQNQRIETVKTEIQEEAATVISQGIL